MIEVAKSASVPVTRKPRSPWQQRVIIALSLLPVNMVAVAGQYGWAHEHLKGWGTFGQALFAIALELVALAVAYHAYLAELANDSALRLKLASYGLGLFVGILNASHYMQDGHVSVVGIVVGMMSASSPALWGMFCRRISRDKLAANGLIESHSLRLGATRWLWHPYRCARLMWWATWAGESRISKAISAHEIYLTKRQEVKEEQRIRQELDSLATTQVET